MYTYNGYTKWVILNESQTCVWLSLKIIRVLCNNTEWTMPLNNIAMKIFAMTKRVDATRQQHVQYYCFVVLFSVATWLSTKLEDEYCRLFRHRVPSSGHVVTTHLWWYGEQLSNTGYYDADIPTEGILLHKERNITYQKDFGRTGKQGKRQIVWVINLTRLLWS